MTSLNFKKQWWKSSYKLPSSFILFFVLVFFFIGEQLPALPLYLGGPTGTGDKVSILDLAPPDAIHRPFVYLLIGIVLWILFRKFAWPIVCFVGAVLAVLDQLFVTPLDHRPSISGLSGLIVYIATVFIFWGILTLVPYFIYRTVDRKWGKRGKQNAVLITLAINLSLLGFFAYQIFYLHHSYHDLQKNESSRQHNQQSSLSSGQSLVPPAARQNPSSNQKTYPDLKMSTPYVHEADISSINEAFSATEQSPWGFRHVGIDFMSATDSIPVQAAADGAIEMVNTAKENERQGWHTGLCINHTPYLICYNFETFSASQAVGDRQKAAIEVKNGDLVKQGDVLGTLVHGGDGAHIDFGVVPMGGSGDRICPEPYFTEEAKASIVRLIHKDHPTWHMCYE